MLKECKYCHQNYSVALSRYERSKYCSKECMNLDKIAKKYVYNCDNCNKEIIISESDYKKLINGENKHKFCNRECANNYMNNKKEKICLNCGQTFFIGNSFADIQKFCSAKCYNDYKNKNTKKITKNCKYCGSEFSTYYKSKVFCNRSCASNFKSQQHTIKCNCDYCGKEFKLKLNQYNNFNSHYCSKECKYKAILQNKISNIQIIINEVLNELNIDYTNEEMFGSYFVDNYLTENNLVIENMGKYWHCTPWDNNNINEMQYKNIQRDKAKRTYLKNQFNINILYLWEDDINNNIELCKQLICLYINNNGRLQNYNSFNYCIINDNIFLKEELLYPYQEQDLNSYKYLYKK